MKETFSLSFEIRPLLELYEELDLKIEKFKKETGLDCIRGCGECCAIESKRIEVSIFELIPLSLHLWETGRAEGYLEKMHRMGEEEPCIFYRQNLSEKEEGCCSIYPWRPLICRLFGFSAIENKYGQPVAVLCSVLKKSRPEVVKEVDLRIQKGLEIPINSYYAKRITLLHPIYGNERYSMNEAVKKAIEWVGFYMELKDSSMFPSRSLSTWRESSLFPSSPRGEMPLSL